MNIEMQQYSANLNLGESSTQEYISKESFFSLAMWD